MRHVNFGYLCVDSHITLSNITCFLAAGSDICTVILTYLVLVNTLSDQQFSVSGGHESSNSGK